MMPRTARMAARRAKENVFQLGFRKPMDISETSLRNDNVEQHKGQQRPPEYLPQVARIYARHRWQKSCQAEIGGHKRQEEPTECRKSARRRHEAPFALLQQLVSHKWLQGQHSPEEA